MKGIYLTAECKAEIESKIAELKKPAPHWDGIYVSEKAEERIEVYKEILSSATILPVEESWTNMKDMLDINTLPISYKQGVIIKTKQ